MHRLRSNDLGDEGTITICKALSESKVNKLQELDLSKNNIGSTGGEALGGMLLVHGSMTSLNVRLNTLGNDGKAALRKAVERRTGFELMI